MTRLTHLGVGLLCLLALTGAAVGQSAAVTFATTAGEAQPGGDVTVTFTYENTGNASQTAIVNVTSIPDGWNVTDRRDDGGTWSAGDRTWLFPIVASGSSVSPSLTLSVPADVDGTYNVTATGANDDAEQTSSVTFAFGSESSTGTETPTDGPRTDATETTTGESTEATDESTEATDEPTEATGTIADGTADGTGDAATTGGSGDGFGVAVTALAALCLGLLARRRR